MFCKKLNKQITLSSKQRYKLFTIINLLQNKTVLCFECKSNMINLTCQCKCQCDACKSHIRTYSDEKNTFVSRRQWVIRPQYVSNQFVYMAAIPVNGSDIIHRLTYLSLDYFDDKSFEYMCNTPMDPQSKIICDFISKKTCNICNDKHHTTSCPTSKCTNCNAIGHTHHICWASLNA